MTSGLEKESVVLLVGGAGGIVNAVTRTLLGRGATVLRAVPAGEVPPSAVVAAPTTATGLNWSGLRQDYSVTAIVHFVYLDREHPASLTAASVDDFDAAYAATIDRSFVLFKEAVPLLQERGGSVLTIAVLREDDGVVEAAMIGGLEMMTRAIAMEHRSQTSVRINLLKHRPNETTEKAAAGLAAYLISRGSSYVTGAILPARYYGRARTVYAPGLAQSAGERDD